MGLGSEEPGVPPWPHCECRWPEHWAVIHCLSGYFSRKLDPEQLNPPQHNAGPKEAGYKLEDQKKCAEETSNMNAETQWETLRAGH